MKIFTKISTYLQLSYQELRKVIWPDRKTTTSHTILVIGVSLGISAFLGLADYLFTRLFEVTLKLFA